MKKILVIALLILAAFFVVSPRLLPPKTPPAVPTQTAPSVSVMIDNGTDVATVSGVAADNAFQALTKAAETKQIAVKSKQYDFGVFVEQIGDVVNTKEKSWIYSVNGVSGTVAADKQNIKQGDSVEWKYVIPRVE